MSRRDRHNKLSAAEAERLALLSEEMGECIQAIGKIQRGRLKGREQTQGEVGLDPRMGGARNVMPRAAQAPVSRAA